MNILIVRNVDIKKEHHINCEIQLVKALKKLGHKSKLIGIGDKNKFENELISLKMPFNKRRFYILKLILFLPIYCVIKKIDVIIVDVRTILGTLIILIIKKIFAIKVIFDVRSIPVEMNLPWDYKLSCVIANKYFDGATFITDGTKSYVENLIKVKYNKSEIFPSAVNLSLFHSRIINNIPLSVKEKTKGKLILLYHGSISPNRGISLVIDAINQIKNTYPNLLFISISDNNNYISDYCNSNNYLISDNLLLLDIIQHEKLAAYINLADICVVPLPRILWWEISSPLKLMEYLAMEKPIILSDIKAHLDVIPRDSDFAVYFNPDDKNDLSKKISEAISNLNNLKNNAAKGREIARQKFTWDIQAKVIEEFIKKI